MPPREVTFDIDQLPPDLQDIIHVERLMGEMSLHKFVELAWPVLEPGRKFMGNWHIDAICDHLEAVSNGEIIKLLINIPPRTSKSIICSVMWPVWDWIAHPSRRFLTASYAQDLSTRDSVKARRLLQSDWFRERWGDRFTLTGDQNAKTRYENNHTGYRIATAVGAIATGEGGDIQIIDDPHNVREAESEAVREDTLLWLDETMSNRFNPPHPPQRVMIMQRVHPRDCSGHVIEKIGVDPDKSGYVHICLPMRFEVDRKRQFKDNGMKNPDYVPVTPLGFEDPREVEGELLDPIRFSDDDVDDLEKGLGPYATAGQHQQRPTPRGGGMVKYADLNFIDEIPSGVQLRSIRSWDYAATDPEKQTSYTNPDWTCGVLLGCDMKEAGVDPDIYIIDVVRFRQDPGERDAIVEHTARNVDGRNTTVWIEQEPGASGKTIIFNARKLLAGYAVNPPRIDPMPMVPGRSKKPTKEAGVPSGNKVQRAEAFATHCHRQKVYILRRDWTDKYVDEITKFPLSEKKDQMDATSLGFNRMMETPAGTAELMHARGGRMT